VKPVASRSEVDIYQKLDLPYIEPELREGRGELKAAREGPLPDLIDPADVKGDLHSHTTLSDGRDSLEEMAQAARDRGYKYLAITDHSASHGFGDHVTAERLWERIEEVRAWNKRSGQRSFRLLSGSEINIGLDGSLDYPDDLVAALDWVVASVHTSFNVSEKQMTERVVTAIENPNVDCIGHLTGRLIGRREPYGIDVEAVAEAAARTGTMIEINGNPNRRDLSDLHARLAVEAGVKIVLNTDAHGVDTLDNMAYAVATARRAWLTADDVANTRGWAAFKKLLGAKA
jgi:DNA polymerase (family 10)